MKVKIAVTAMLGDEEKRLELHCEDNVVDILIDDEIVCSTDWDANIKPVFELALDLFDDK